MEKVAFLFGGEGNPFVGQDNLIRYDVFQRTLKQADRICQYGYSIEGLMINGPQSALDRPLYGQPALLSLEVGILNILRKIHEGFWNDLLPQARIFHGLGVGKWAAEVASRALSASEGFRLAKERGLELERAKQHPVKRNDEDERRTAFRYLADVIRPADCLIEIGAVKSLSCEIPELSRQFPVFFFGPPTNIELELDRLENVLRSNPNS